MMSVNSVIAFAGIPALPFGGVGDSGFGRIHGEDGLREFTRPQAVARQRLRRRSRSRPSGGRTGRCARWWASPGYATAR